MPKDFDQCMSEGGKVRTMPIKGGRYAHICIDKMGKTHMGEVMMKGQKTPATEKQGG